MSLPLILSIPSTEYLPEDLQSAYSEREKTGLLERNLCWQLCPPNAEGESSIQFK